MAPGKSKNSLSKEEVESPRIQNLVDAIFGVSSSKEERDEGKDTEGGGSSGHEKLGEDPSFALGTNTVDPTHSIGEEMNELGFFMRHLSREELSKE